MTSIHRRRKLIEVALPLEKINTESAREKSIRHGHPSTLHLWWARRPLAAARAVLFAQLVDDPSAVPEEFPTPEAQAAERQRLFRLIEQLVAWESTTNEQLLAKAREEIWKSWRRTCRDNAQHPRAAELFNPDRLPAFHDPFAGGGAIPLEAQRLGLEAYASDLNPVAVLINKAMIEIPARFRGHPPVNPENRREKIGDRGEEGGVRGEQGSVSSGGNAPSASAGMSNRIAVTEPGTVQQQPISSLLSPISYKGAQGLAADVRYYGQWMRDEAERRIGQLYPTVTITPELAADRPDLKPLVGQQLTVIAWLWARTVKSPNPAFAHVDVPLASTFMLSTKPGKEAYVEPVIAGDTYRFTVKVGKPQDPERVKRGTKLARGANFECLLSGMPITGDYIKAEGCAGRMGARLMAIVAEGPRGRVYLPPIPEHEEIARQAQPVWKPEEPLHGKARDQMPLYGMETFADLFTPRQLVALNMFADLVGEAMERVKADYLQALGAPGVRASGAHSQQNDADAQAYAEAVGVYLSIFLSRFADLNNALCQWRSDPAKQHVGHLFARQAIPMVWDFAEANPFCDSAGGFEKTFTFIPKVLTFLNPGIAGKASCSAAQNQTISTDKIISTDPPYYDNIGYADLSDFFYVWLRRTLRPVYPDLFATVAVPKAEELVATPYRHGSKAAAERFFMDGMTTTLQRLAAQAHPAFPVTIYYAFKQSENLGARASGAHHAGETPALPAHAMQAGETPTSPGVVSTGWETFLSAVIRAGFAITGTWPMRTELSNRMLGKDTNALASSIVLVCRQRPADAPVATRRALVQALKAELPHALRDLQAGNIAPVDLAQAAIGPGMAVYSRYAQVLDAQGQPVTVREALALINQVLDETLAEQEGDFDADTRWALAWFEQYGFSEGEFGVAETLSKAKNTSVDGLVAAGILEAKRGRVRLFRPAELPADWDPARDARCTHWEVVHQLIRVLETGGETATAVLLTKLGSRADVARELAYRLYSICERKQWADEALSYNALVQSWGEVVRLAGERAAGMPVQQGMEL